MNKTKFLDLNNNEINTELYLKFTNTGDSLSIFNIYDKDLLLVEPISFYEFCNETFKNELFIFKGPNNKTIVRKVWGKFNKFDDDINDSVNNILSSKHFNNTIRKTKNYISDDFIRKNINEPDFVKFCIVSVYDNDKNWILKCINSEQVLGYVKYAFKT